MRYCVYYYSIGGLRLLTSLRIGIMILTGSGVTLLRLMIMLELGGMTLLLSSSMRSSLTC